jgi:hypothetical protein
MRAIHFPEANTTFNKPADMTDEQCYSVSALVGEQDGIPYVRTVWLPNKEDLEALNAGRPLVLSICGAGMPPVALFTCDENGNVNE